MPLTVIKESAAMALACNRPIAETPSLSLADAVAVQQPLADLLVYDTGGRLVRYLIDQDGPETFLRFYTSLRQDASFADLDAALRASYGSGADDLWAAPPWPAPRPALAHSRAREMRCRATEPPCR